MRESVGAGFRVLSRWIEAYVASDSAAVRPTFSSVLNSMIAQAFDNTTLLP
jgi:hypothetical protein